MAAFVQYVVEHNTLIIEALIVLILLTVSIIALRQFLFAKEIVEHGSVGGSVNMDQINEALKKILEKAQAVPSLSNAGAGAAAGAGSSAPVQSAEAAALAEEIQLLKKDLTDKQAEIQALKSGTTPTAAADGSVPAPAAAAAGASGAGLSDEEKSKLMSQIQELQGKLQEYEIISEDIADLSFYKEENAKLQNEIAQLKAGGATAASSAPLAAAAATPAPASAEPPAESAAPVEEATAEAAPSPAPPAPKAEEAVVAKPAEPKSVETQPQAEPSVAAPSVKTEAAPNAVEAKSEIAATAAPIAENSVVDEKMNEEILKEFESAVAEQKQPGDASASLESTPVDFDKMMEEANGLSAKSPAGAESVEAAKVDPEKIAKEAQGLASPSDKAVMEQFEEFVKKGQAS